MVGFCSRFHIRAYGNSTSAQSFYKLCVEHYPVTLIFVYLCFVLTCKLIIHPYFILLQSVLAPNCTVLESELEDDEPSEDALDGEVGWSPFSELNTYMYHRSFLYVYTCMCIYM